MFEDAFQKDRTSGEGFEFRAKKDTFEALHRSLGPLIAEEKYDEARAAMARELKMLNDALGGDPAAELSKLRQEFESTLPEEIQQILNPESAETRSRRLKEQAAKLAEEVANSRLAHQVDDIEREEREGSD